MRNKEQTRKKQKKHEEPGTKSSKHATGRWDGTMQEHRGKTEQKNWRREKRGHNEWLSDGTQVNTEKGGETDKGRKQDDLVFFAANSINTSITNIQI